jgi:hypothetical protein
MCGRAYKQFDPFDPLILSNKKPPAACQREASNNNAGRRITVTAGSV